jgi:hypothetical protein
MKVESRGRGTSAGHQLDLLDILQGSYLNSKLINWSSTLEFIALILSIPFISPFPFPNSTNNRLQGSQSQLLRHSIMTILRVGIIG